MEDEAPAHEKALPAMTDFKVKEILEAQKACRYWQASIPLCIFCGTIGTIVALVACIKLCFARRTLKTPVLVPVLLMIWPVLALANTVLNFIGIDYPAPLLAGVEIVRILLTFFVSLAIFTQWKALLPAEELDDAVRWWERLAMFSRLPVAAMYAWVMVLCSDTDWALDLETAQHIQLSTYEVRALLVAAGAMLLLGMASLYSEYQLMGKLQTRLWGRMLFRKTHKPAFKKNRAPGLAGEAARGTA